MQPFQKLDCLHFFVFTEKTFEPICVKKNFFPLLYRAVVRLLWGMYKDKMEGVQRKLVNFFYLYAGASETPKFLHSKWGFFRKIPEVMMAII